MNLKNFINCGFGVLDWWQSLMSCVAHTLTFVSVSVTYAGPEAYS